MDYMGYEIRTRDTKAKEDVFLYIYCVCFLFFEMFFEIFLFSEKGLIGIAIDTGKCN